MTKKKDTKKTKRNMNPEWEELSVRELKIELQKKSIDVKSGVEENSSVLKKLRKAIAQKLTEKNLNK